MRYTKEITLKDGTQCVLRSAGASDAAAVLGMLRTACGETDNLLRYADEVTMTVEQEEEFLSKMEANPRALMLTAWIDGKIVGNAGLNLVGGVERTQHRVGMGISVLKECWGKGVGSVLMTTIIEVVRDAGYTQLELGVVETNDRAMALYEKFGFVRYGTVPNAMRYRDGRAVDEHLMYKIL